MKECPECRKTYADDLFFCLDHGLPLQPVQSDVDANAPTDVNPDLRFDGKTERLVVPVPATEILPPSAPSQPTIIREKPITTSVVEPTAGAKTSKGLYVVIAILLVLCFGLIGALLFSNRDKLLGSATNTVSTPEPTKVPPSPQPSASRQANVSPTASPTPVEKRPENQTAAGTWRGEWKTDSGTLFDFELTLTNVGDDKLDGRVRWTMRRTARPDKNDKIGLSATEYVRGSVDEGEVKLKGYRKDDPDNVLVMLDEYKLRLSSDGKRLIGLARNGGKWNGKVDLGRSGAAAN